ncbi:MAG TPA: WhiB family transcriptional regulator [Pseudonocardiaceae bacterium]|nr:WhiB family transcriptional regulator [Pseudonocardiaceae bacterium]
MKKPDSQFFADTAALLDRMRPVPNEVLCTLVRRDGACMSPVAGLDEPECAGGGTDRDVAAQICAGCGVRDACLELEFRTAGPATLGVWGALAEDDRRAAYRAWSRRRDERQDGGRA